MHEEHYPECEYQDIVTRIIRAQRRSVAMRLKHKLISTRLAQSLNASEIMSPIYSIKELFFNGQNCSFQGVQS